MPRPRYSAAIVGTGAIAAVHASALREHADRVDLVAVADVNPGSARHWNVAHTYGTLAHLMQTEQLDLVHLCTPPSTHAPLALELLRAGVTVLIEKPPTLSLAELDRLTDAARSGPRSSAVSRCGVTRSMQTTPSP